MSKKDNINKIEVKINEKLELSTNLSKKDEEIINKINFINEEFPILKLKDNVLLPGILLPISYESPTAISLIEKAIENNSYIGVFLQKSKNENDDVHEIGCLAKIIRKIDVPHTKNSILVQGIKKLKLNTISFNEEYHIGSVDTIDEIFKFNDNEVKEFDELTGYVEEFIRNIDYIPNEAIELLTQFTSKYFTLNYIVSNFIFDPKFKQDYIDKLIIGEKIKLCNNKIINELKNLNIKKDIENKVKVDLDKQQRNYFLNQQMRQIQDELGDNPNSLEIEKLEKKSRKKNWSKKISKHFNSELSRLKNLNPQFAEFGVQSNYLKLMVDLPWKKKSDFRIDIDKSKKILDEDHYGLEKVKDRILEHLAVKKLLNDNSKSPILCLYGPPGVGKTSLGKSIAKALGRKYVRMSLGGVRDESEIRGHRKTYIGAMPGNIIKNIKKANSSNPVFVLDEIDKIVRDKFGDPSSALLEVLDPEQNKKFNDNFLEVPYDISDVFFIATANDLSTIQKPLLDRMEIIHITGYSVEEKLEIAKRHIIHKELLNNGVPQDKIMFSDDILTKLIEDYTFESGVRKFEQKIAKLIRNRAMYIAKNQEFNPEFNDEDLLKILGPAHSKDKYQESEIPGVVTGLAWTENGGDILYIESSMSKGKGILNLTGNLGNVMKESANLALQYIKSNAMKFGIDEDIFENKNFHIHVPEGATPKDGPSAGITIFTSFISTFTQKIVKERLAMTGEITLRGKVLPVGGIKEKILAAKRAGYNEIILSDKNEKDILDIEPIYIKDLKFHYVSEMKDVIDIALNY